MDTETLASFKWNMMCRTCLCEDVELQPIFDNYSQLIANNTSVDLPDMIISCTSIQISMNDTFPQHICSECVKQLLSAFYFKTKCINSATTLKQIQLKEHEDAELNNWKPIDIKTEIYMYDENDSSNEITQVTSDAEVIHNEPVKRKKAKPMKENNIIRKKRMKKEASKPQHEDGENNHVLRKRKRKAVVKEDFSDDEDIDDDLDGILTDTGTNEQKPKKKKVYLKRHACPECEKRFDSQKRLERHRSSMAHQRNQPGKVIKTCLRCKIYFDDVTAYTEHAKSHDIYLCADCGHVCKSRSGYQAHLASHSTLQPHECNECGRKYKSISALQVHQRNHTGERRYECEHCGTKFITWNSMKNHIRTHHTKERRHVCQVCGKAFTQSGSLNIHMRQHTGEKPYPCSECDMAFRSYGDRKCHMVKHTGERRYPCTVCSKRFARPYNLTQHMVTHTGQRNHVCSICGRAFTQAHVLRGHLRTHPEHDPLQVQGA